MVLISSGLNSKILLNKILLLRPFEIRATSLFRPVFVIPKWYFPYDNVVNIKATSLIRPLLESPKGLNIGILRYMLVKDSLSILVHRKPCVLVFLLTKCKEFLQCTITLLHSERPELYTILAFLSAIGLTSYCNCHKKLKNLILLAGKSKYFSVSLFMVKWVYF